MEKDFVLVFGQSGYLNFIHWTFMGLLAVLTVMLIIFNEFPSHAIKQELQLEN